ncbi:MAG: hypothetical protein A2378_03095 [Candidatus Pacebacteria bacterium RIFOXYB1_FULL_44_10]|nr:MAG: hypothetical protein A2378_03095 [Candidatus Pacebacteria bacterium RIFOXYB1_FULL_44_10]
MNRQTISFLLPILVVILIGATFSYRWWSSRTTSLTPSPIPLSEGMRLEEQTSSTLERLGLTDRQNVSLEPQNGTVGSAMVSLSEDGKGFTAILSTEDQDSTYEVWMQTSGGANQVKLGKMRFEKAGFVLDFSQSTALENTFTVSISKETTIDGVQETVVFSGNVNRE